jgi:hypothetical protein
VGAPVTVELAELALLVLLASAAMHGRIAVDPPQGEAPC